MYAKPNMETAIWARRVNGRVGQHPILSFFLVFGLSYALSYLSPRG